VEADRRRLKNLRALEARGEVGRYFTIKSKTLKN
jgi:hypothetical protein